MRILFMARTVFVLEDDPDYLAFLKFTLQANGYTCVGAESVAEARQTLRATIPDILILDAHLPDGSGLDFCRELRKDPRLGKCLIVILTAMRSVTGGERWVQDEADACWPKTRSGTRIHALITALLRRRDWDTKTTFPHLPEVMLDPVQREVHFMGKSSGPLSRREFLFLHLLLNAYPSPLSRETIYENLYPAGKPEQLALDLNSMVKRLRDKLPKELAKDIQAARDVGYCLMMTKKS